MSARLEPPPHDPDDQLGVAISAGCCPDCGYRGFVLGPRGGAAQNIECGNLHCRARFNVTMFAAVCVFAERISREAEGGSPWGSPDTPFAGTRSKPAPWL